MASALSIVCLFSALLLIYGSIAQEMAENPFYSEMVSDASAPIFTVKHPALDMILEEIQSNKPHRRQIDSFVFNYTLDTRECPTCLAVPTEVRDACEVTGKLTAVLFDISVPILTRVKWLPLSNGCDGGCTLGSGGASNIWKGYSEFLAVNSRFDANTWFGSPLANQILRRDIRAELPEINIQLNSNYPSWSFDLTGKSIPGKSDFVSVIMHELLHGFSFSSGAGSSSTTYFRPTSNCVPCTQVFDTFVQNSAGTTLKSIVTSDNTNAYQNLVVSNDAYFVSPSAAALGSQNAFKISAPTVYRGGSSMSHLDSATYGARTNPHALMTPSIGAGTVLHHPGGYALMMLKDMGWKLRDCTAYTDCLSCFNAYCNWCQDPSSTSGTGFCGDPAAKPFFNSEKCTGYQTFLNSSSQCSTKPTTPVVVIPLTQADKDSIVSEHNRIRSQVVPPAQNMQTVTWDDGLAQIWANYPNHCSLSHTEAPYRNSTTGENLALNGGSSPYTVAQYIGLWEDEKADWTYAPLGSDCAQGAVCGHYTQLIWHHSNRVGCALINCSTAQSGKYTFGCNYYQTGNYLSTLPYTRTPACTPVTCEAQGYECGTVSNTCGGNTTCSGTCGVNQRCVNNKCQSCITTTCGLSNYECGSLFNGCGTESCGTCPSYQTCESNACVNTTTSSCVPKTCAERGVTCGSIRTECDSTIDCGPCPLPCNGACDVNVHKTCNTNTNKCECLSGYPDNGFGECVATPSSPSEWTAVKGSVSDWQVFFDGNTNLNTLYMFANGVADHSISWTKARQYSSPQRTGFSFDAKVTTSQTLGLGMRFGQSTGATDASLWTFAVNAATGDVTVAWDLIYYGRDNFITQATQTLPRVWNVNGFNNIKVVISDISGKLQHVVSVNGVGLTYIWTTSTSNFPDVGGMYLYTNSPAYFRNVVASSTNTIYIALDQCLTEDEFKRLVASALNIAPEKVVVNRGDDDQGKCNNKRQAGGAPVSSAFTFTLASDPSMSSIAMESTLSQLASQGSPQLPTQVTAYTAAEPIAEASAPLAEAGLGIGAGAGAAGLSTGAIIGIAVGGGVAALLAVAAVAAVVAVVVIIVVRKKRSDDYFNQPTTDIEMVEQPQRKARKSIFHKKPRTGVNIYDNDPNKHKSITGRVTSNYVDVQAAHVSKD